MDTTKKMRMLYHLDWEKLSEILAEEWNLPLKKVKKILRRAEQDISLYRESYRETDSGWYYIWKENEKWVVDLPSKRTYDITFR